MYALNLDTLVWTTYFVPQVAVTGTTVTGVPRNRSHSAMVCANDSMLVYGGHPNNADDVPTKGHWLVFEKMPVELTSENSVVDPICHTPDRAHNVVDTIPDTPNRAHNAGDTVFHTPNRARNPMDPFPGAPNHPHNPVSGARRASDRPFSRRNRSSITTTP